MTKIKLKFNRQFNIILHNKTKITSVFWSTSFTIDMILKFTALVFVSDIKKKGEKRVWERISFITHFFRSLLNLFTFTSPSHSLLSAQNFSKTWTRTKQCAPLLILIRLIFLFTCQIILYVWPSYRYEKRVCACLCAYLFVCHTTYILCTFKCTCVYKFDKEK